MYYARLDQYGHASQILDDHLKGVALNMKAGFFWGVNFPHFDANTLLEVLDYMGYYHDLGKYMDYFQNYLINNIESPYSDHAQISAIYLYQILRKKLNIKDFKEINNILAFFAYVCVAQHHGNVNIMKFCTNYYDNTLPKLKTQAENLLCKKYEVFKESSIQDYTDLAFFETSSQLTTGLLQELKLHLMHQYITTRLRSEEWFFLVIYLFSLLIDNDKLDSAGVEKRVIRMLPREAVNTFLDDKNKFQNSITSKRESVRHEVKKVLKDLSAKEIENKRFYMLTAPTGMGKTLLSIECAMELQKIICERECYTPRIITAIPFINIIEQTNMVYKKVFGDHVNLIVHHRLADYGQDSVKEEIIPLDRTLLEVESWEGEVVLTTFVQFFHSILTSRNRALKKLNKLAGSIVILDEVQTLPEEYMPLLGAILIKLSEYYGTRFILMTATQPHLLLSGCKLLKESVSYTDRAIELLPQYDRYFKDLNRTQLVVLLDKVFDTNSFVELVLEKWNYIGSVLIVVNTIKRSINIFNVLKERLRGIIPEENIGYLSTNIIPAQRKEVIKMARQALRMKDGSNSELDKNSPYILVSTQTIEAGVDLDFDMAFRDIAPLDSLIQTAGRVNREALKEKYRPVYLVKLGDDSGRVYSMSDINFTNNFLKNFKIIKEHEYQQLIETYHNCKYNRPLPDKSKEIWEDGILRLNFEKIEEFELIKKTGNILDVFVEFDDFAKKIADAYEEIISNKEKVDLNKLQGVIDNKYLIKTTQIISFQTRKALLKLVMAKMNDYIISIRDNRISNNVPPKFSDRSGIKSDLLFIPNTQLSYYYDSLTGFKDDTGEAYIF